TLFGRNTTAGIIKFTSKKPTEEYTADASVTYGRFDTFNAQAGVGGAIIPGLLSTRASVLYQSRQDWIDNAFTGQNDALGGFEEIAGRLQFLLTPSDDFTALVNIHGRSLDGTSSVFRANIFDTGSNELNSNFDRDRVFFDQGDNNPQEYDSWGGSIKLDYDVGGVTLTSISGYEGTEGRSLGDVDGGIVGATSFFDPANPPAGPLGVDTIRFPSQTQDSIDELDQFTQAIRIASNSAGPLQWQAGGYFFYHEFEITTVNPAAVGAGGDDPFAFPPAPTTVQHENTLWAVFGQASYDLTSDLTLTTGVRYTDDDRELQTLTQVFGPVDDVSIDASAISFDVSALYSVNEDVNVFARVARGFRGPAIQGRDIAFAESPTTAEEEINLSFEGGFKSVLLEDRARLNVTGYYYRVNDQQFSVIGGAANSNQVINADRGVGWGFEADGELFVTENLLTTMGVSYNNTEIKDNDLATATCGSGLCTPLDPTNDVINPVTGRGQALIDGNPFPQAPEWTFNVTARYGIPVSPVGEIYLFTDWAYQSSYNFFLYESVEFQTDGQVEGGARLGYIHNNGQFEIAAFARNITNEENVKGIIDFNNLAGFVNEPRIWGLTVSTQF
ncbi:MAG: TonB-dependent receptor, partial [Pseudomonadota bacterium]